MTFAAPWALLLLIPWLATALYVLLATRDVAYVPFIRLWPKSEVTQQARRSVHQPPWWVVGILGAILLAIFAAAGASILGVARTITIVIDCNWSMSPPGRIAAALAPLNLSAADEIDVVPPNGKPFISWGTINFSRLHFTAADTAAAVDRTLRDVLTRTSGAVFVVSDRSPEVKDDRICWLRPGPLNDAGIDAFSAVPLPGDRPRVEAMVRVFNGSAASRATLAVSGQTRTLDLPPRGQARDFFVDVDEPADGILRANIDVADDIDEDNSAFLARQTIASRVEADLVLSVPLQRLLGVYDLFRHSSERGKIVQISTAPPPDSVPAVWLASSGASDELDMSRLQIAAHPINSQVRWIYLPPLRAQKPPGAGWTTIVGSGDLALVAVREKPSRAVWIGCDLDSISDRPEYVILWASVLDWLSGGEHAYTAEPPSGLFDWEGQPVGEDMKTIDFAPHVSTHSDGTGYAVAARVPRGPEAAKDGTAGTASLRPALRRTASAWPLSKPLAILALGLFALSLAGRPRLT